jgi:hypothetical protein
MRRKNINFSYYWIFSMNGNSTLLLSTTRNDKGSLELYALTILLSKKEAPYKMID